MARSNIIPMFIGCDRPVGPPPRAVSDRRDTLFRAMDLGTGDSVILADAGRVVLRVGQQTEEMHNLLRRRSEGKRRLPPVRAGRRFGGKKSVPGPDQGRELGR